MQGKFLEILNNIKLFDKIRHFLRVCYKVTLLDVKYSYKQIFDQCKNMIMNGSSIYLHQRHSDLLRSVALPKDVSSGWLGPVCMHEEQPIAFSLRSLNEAGRSGWWCWKLCTADLNPGRICLGVKITVEAKLKLMGSLFQKFTFHHVMLHLQRYSPRVECQWDVKIPLHIWRGIHLTPVQCKQI